MYAYQMWRKGSNKINFHVSVVLIILLEGLIFTSQQNQEQLLPLELEGVEYVPVGALVQTPPLKSSVSEEGRVLIRNRREGVDAMESVKAVTSSATNKNSTISSKNSSAHSQAPVHKVKEKTLFVPDRSPPNITPEQRKEESFSDDDEDVTSSRPGQGRFDEKAVQRAIIVISGIAVIVVVYLGVKFFLIKKRKVVKRYGRVESSEMDLLEEGGDDEESEEEEELFDINRHRS